MKITKLLSICAIAVSAFAFTSCNSEVEGTRTFGDFVNYMGESQDNYSVFRYYPGLTNEDAINILSNVSWADGLKPAPGTRVISFFQIDVNQELTNGIKLQSAGVIGLNTVGSVFIQDITSMPTSSMFYLNAATRSGNYIDIQALGNPKDTELQLFCSEKSLEPTSEVAELYLVYTDNNVGNSSETAYYASFDISEVLNYPNIKSLRLRVNNMNGNSEHILAARGNE